MNVENIVNKAIDLGATYGVRVIGVLIALYIAFKVAGWSKARIMASLDKRKFDSTLTRFFANMTRYAIIMGTVLGCMGVFGIETTSFAAVIGAAGLAVGLAFQGTLSNFSSGVMLLIFRPFNVGDVISVAGTVGAVQEIELFTTSMLSPDNRHFIVPNSAIFGATIENITRASTRRVDIPVGCAYSADIAQTRAVLERAAAAVPGRLDDPKPQVFLAGLGGSSVDWSVRVWCETGKYWDVYQASIEAVKKHLDEAGIGIPFPQQDVHLDPELLKALAGR